MRVINLKSSKRQKATRGRYLQVIFIIYISAITIVGLYLYKANNGESYLSTTPTKVVMTTPKEVVFRTLSGEQFKEIYNNFHYVNTNKILTLPPITGDAAADSRIRTLAEARGYKVRREARNTTVEADGYPLQRLAGVYWQKLKTEAAKDGIVLTVTSGFRSIEDQRAIFIEGLSAQGISAQQISSGQVDGSVYKVLQTYAPPGYSRHHTGYTIDLTCGTNGLTNFATTVCFEWLSSDNYIHAKTFGWIPSYPEGGGLQGPEPEPWEYIWTSIDSLIK